MKRLVRCRKSMFAPGEHDAKLVAIETVPSLWKREKDSLEFRFEGETCEISKITGVVLRIGESLHALAEQLVGASICCGDELDLDAFIGRKYRIDVAGGQTGGVSVERITPITE
jgi:hypothetical protein